MATRQASEGKPHDPRSLPLPGQANQSARHLRDWPFDLGKDLLQEMVKSLLELAQGKDLFPAASLGQPVDEMVVATDFLRDASVAIVVESALFAIVRNHAVDLWKTSD